MNKFIVSNIKYLNSNHQSHIFGLIENVQHSTNQNGCFFKLSDIDPSTLTEIYTFMKKIQENSNSNIEEKRNDIILDLQKNLNQDPIVENNIVPLKRKLNKIEKKITNSTSHYNMDDIEQKMKDHLKGPVYKPGTIHHRILKTIKKKSRPSYLNSRINSPPTYVVDEKEIIDNNDNDYETDDEKEFDEKEFDEKDIDDEKEIDEKEIDEKEIDEKEIDDDDVETLRLSMMKTLLISHGFKITDNSSLQLEQYI